MVHGGMMNPTKRHCWPQHEVSVLIAYAQIPWGLLYVGLDAAYTVYPKISGILGLPQNFILTLATPQNIPILYLDQMKKP